MKSNTFKLRFLAKKVQLVALCFFISQLAFSKEIYVSVVGNDSNEGSINQPFASINRAVSEAKKVIGKEAVTIWMNEGTYHISETLLLDASFSGTAQYPFTISAVPGAKVTIKGSKVLDGLLWKEFKDGVYVAQVPKGLEFDQIFVNNQRQVRARFPNYDYQNPLRGGNGYLKVTGGTDRRFDEWFSYNPNTFTQKEWSQPETGIVHAFQSHNWGNMQYRVKSIDRKNNKVFLGEGGWQLQRKFGIGGTGEKASWFYIENIFEELDVPGEWFLDTEHNLLYYYPAAGVNLQESIIEVPLLKDLIQLKGTSQNPVKHITIKGINFTHSTLTFMEDYEPVARGDWAIHRGGAVFMEGAENCNIEDCNFEYLGGNGVFMCSYNRNNVVRNCRFVHTGESAVCFVGSPSAVRFYQTWDDWEIKGKDWDDMRKNMDLKPGPKSPDYPKNCVVENSIMHDFGDFGKQVAGVYISMSHKIRVSHNTIYNCPRAGICINDGTWGGHIIENCDIWETVRETGEHGPFNSWGRERQWRFGSGSDEHFLREYTKLDAIDVTILRNNRIANFRKSVSAGNWTIDLDDGSSNYEIYNNLNLGSTIKLRDGMYRKVYNNITVSAVPLGWHVWPKKSFDEVHHNIFVISGAVPGKTKPTEQFIRAIRLPSDVSWSNNYDYNLYWNVNEPNNPKIAENKSMAEWQAQGYDQNAVVAKPLFKNPEKGDYSVQENSPALKLGFKNFPMNEFGHQMTRIVPYGGKFSNNVEVELKADKRMESGGSLHFTVDGSEPTIHSPVYEAPFILKKSTVLKAKTFDADGNPIGFTQKAIFRKVDQVEHPSWFQTLLDGKYNQRVTAVEKKAAVEEIYGAIMVDIADDPDLIDASGGYNYGCFIKAIDPQKGLALIQSGLSKEWVIQAVNDEKVENISDLKKLLNKYRGKQIHITAVRNYLTKQFTITTTKNE
ncbi:chitobiase/beta-hexosaminidase C-terminal domain-containing protein [Tamlana sp. 62-3]|uniref:Chitobiase/beta-hexosaminidase C-terminal domain-containing protein n=1 Tax=Neotamlana sargassicola TaxID=2883125 RepID=A0A9X1I5X5_9FLAO|nr:right-handed parallel beta-helix repeat-containing protein [Tamlana sargassicola]MCB4807867.1 chitobiase/beta-hexosaminidase C-terminal domain-containing protein [Tamlana sargassicola]